MLSCGPSSLIVRTMLIFFLTSLISVFFFPIICRVQSHSISFRRAIHFKTSTSSSIFFASFMRFSKSSTRFNRVSKGG
eukprot:14717.XXX_459654_459887_1 [CDS] Oithona nana genome sequencing.